MNKQATEGVVTECLPSGRFRVKFEDGRELIAYSAGKMRQNKVVILIGDTVVVEIDPYGGKDTSRIIFRKKR